MGNDVPKIVQLPKPRPLDADERALLDFVLSGPLGRDDLRAQAATAEVVARCDCGCRSVTLKADPETPSAHFTKEESIYGVADSVELTAWGRSRAGAEVQVTRHVDSGRLWELEIWDGAFTQGKSRGELPELKTLKHEAD